MFKENKHKSKINHCTFSSIPLVEVYQRLCSLDTPYLWIKDGRQIEELYYIDDIQTFAGVLSDWWNNSGWELPGRCDDIIRLRLVRIHNDKKYFIEHEIVFPLTSPKCEITADGLLINAGIRIPTPEELLNAVYEDGIPGHIATKEEIELKIQNYKTQIQAYRRQNEFDVDILKQIAHMANRRKITIILKEKNI